MLAHLNIILFHNISGMVMVKNNTFDGRECAFIYSAVNTTLLIVPSPASAEY